MTQVFARNSGKVVTSRTGITVDGLPGLSMNIKRLPAKVVTGLAKGLRTWAEAVVVESGNEVPRITGFLANSVRIVMHRSHTRMSVVIEYLAAYAAAVHEIPRPPTSNGKWKYLEHPYNRLLPDLPNHVGVAIAAELAR